MILNEKIKLFYNIFNLYHIGIYIPNSFFIISDEMIKVNVLLKPFKSRGRMKAAVQIIVIYDKFRWKFKIKKNPSKEINKAGRIQLSEFEM